MRPSAGAGRAEAEREGRGGGCGAQRRGDCERVCGGDLRVVGLWRRRRIEKTERWRRRGVVGVKDKTFVIKLDRSIWNLDSETG